MNPVPTSGADNIQPVRKSAQRIRWFISVFAEQQRRIEAETGNRFDTDQDKLVAVFADWLRAFEAQKPTRAEDKQAYVGFAAGLMLRTLVKRKPVSVVSKPEGADDSNPAFFWPEGYLYVAFCLNVRGLVIEKDFLGEQHVAKDIDDIRTWWSFKENVTDDPGLAIAFLDLFAGTEPNWTMPDLFVGNHVNEIAGRFYHPQLTD